MNRSLLRALGAILSVTVVAIALAACGSDSSSGAKGDNPLDKALHYAPKSTPFVASFKTDPDGSQVKNAGTILKKFPFAGQVNGAIEQAFKTRGVDFDKDIKPLLGNDFVVAATDVRSFLGDDSSDRNFVGAIEVKNKDKLKSALDKEKPKDVGEAEGAKLYQSDDTFYAIDDDVLVVAGTKRDLEAAVKRSRGADSFSESDYDKGTESLPKSAFVRGYFNVKALLDSDPSTASARKVKWIAALRSFGFTAGVQPDSIDIDFKATTDSGSLSDEDLPLAPGSDSPDVIDREGQVGVSLRGLDHIVKFAENAGQVVSPDDFSSYQTAKSTIEKQLNIDIDKDIVGQLSGDISTTISTDGHSAARIKLDDPAAFKSTLAKLNKAIPSIASSSSGRRTTVKSAGGGLFALQSGSTTVVYGVVGDSFVAAQNAADARSVATAPSGTVNGAKGAFAFKTNAEQLVQAALRRFGATSNDSSPLGGLTGALGTSLFTGPLGDLTGSIEAEKDGVSGKISLGFD